MEHDIAKKSSAGLLCNDAISIAVCDDEQFMCDMLEEKIKEALPNAVVCKFSSGKELLDSVAQIDILFLEMQCGRLKTERWEAEIQNIMENGTALIAKQNYPKFVKQYLKYNQRKGREIK